MRDAFVESEDIEPKFTKILNLNVGDVIDTNGNNASATDLDLDYDRGVNLSVNLDSTSTVSLNFSAVQGNSPEQMESEDPNVVLNELRAKNLDRLIIAQI